MENKTTTDVSTMAAEAITIARNRAVWKELIFHPILIVADLDDFAK